MKEGLTFHPPSPPLPRFRELLLLCIDEQRNEYAFSPPLASSVLPSEPVVEQQIVEIEKQNSVINALEREMLRLKAMYEAAVEQRNFAGVQLIDRNDELCVLYEKSNIQETTLTVSPANANQALPR